jgi:hypothetical protein
MSDFDPLTPEERDAQFDSGTNPKRKTKPRDPRPFVRSSPNAPEFISLPWRNIQATRIDLYRSADDAPSLVVERFDWTDQETGARRKIILQNSLRQGENGPVWVREGFPDSEPTPLFNLPEIAGHPDKSVVLVEGEKACEAAHIIFGGSAIATTAPQGAGSFHHADVSPLSGRTVFPWRDNDAPGETWLEAVTKALRGVAKEIRAVDVPELLKLDGGARRASHNPDGWDAADAVVEWTDHAALRVNIMQLAKPACTDNTTVPGGDVADQEKIRAELRQRIDALNSMDEKGARAIVADAVKAKLSEVAVETLIKPLAAKLGVKETSARKFWQKIEREIKDEEGALEAKKREAQSKEELRKLEEERAATRKRLELSCWEIANDPKLLYRLTKVARKAGVIGEDSSVRATYIAASSRFDRRKAICLLRRGAPAGGKSHVTDRILLFIPDEDVVRVSNGSPLSLVYYGGEDEDALKHKIVYVAEAAILAERNGVEGVLTIMLRLLISEGRIDHQVVVPVPNAPATTVHIRRNGPVVVLITSARNNIEEELLTRLMTSDADESQEQTENVIEAALTDEDGEDEREGVRKEIDQWLDYQCWIALDAPYDVSIPYRPAILRAIRAQREAARQRGEKPKFKLRVRRDVHGFLTAIRTSAILHKAQREKQGCIIATLDDYRHAHEAFDPGLVSLYKTTSPLTTIAVVKAIEEMGATTITAVKVTVTALMEKLGITGRGTANDRLRDAEERGYIELVDKPGGYGKTTPREYKIVKSAGEIGKEAGTPFGPEVFPSPEAVEAELEKTPKGGVSPRYSGTDGTKSASDPYCTDHTTVPERHASSQDISLPAEKTDHRPEQCFRKSSRIWKTASVVVGAMRPADIVERARRCGVTLTLSADGTGLSLSADSEPPQEIVDLVRAHKPEIVAHIQAERRRINRWIADCLIEWQDSCLHCRKPVLPGQPWTVVSNGDVSARFHKNCESAWRAGQEALACKTLGLPQ